MISQKIKKYEAIAGVLVEPTDTSVKCGNSYLFFVLKALQIIPFANLSFVDDGQDALVGANGRWRMNDVEWTPI